MQTFKRFAALLMVPMIAYLGAACDGKDKPTEASAPGAAFSSVGDDGDDDHNGLRAVPFAFVGKENDCEYPAGSGYPAGSRIVTAAWLGGMGLPDNGGQNVGADPRDNPSKNDPHRGLLLSKNGRTSDCSSSGASITGVKGMVATATFTLGFDYRNGGHCGAGAPRFNVVVKEPVTNAQSFHYVGGCSNGTQTPASQDPEQWTKARFATANPGQSFPVITPGSKVVSIDLIYDEGTDTGNAPGEVPETPAVPPSGAGVPGPGAAGLAVVDNIYIDGKVITRGSGIDDGLRKGKDGKGKDD